MLLCSLVLSQLDYLNSVLTDLPKATLRPYNHTQRYAARLACNKTKRDSAQDCMKILHWLPIEFRTKFKLLKIVFKTLQGNGPSYLQTKTKFYDIPEDHQEINYKRHYLKGTIQ